MTTVVERDLNLPWEHFLEKESPSENVRRNIDVFRQSDWKSIKRQLVAEYRWNLPEGLEPHWVSPGKAVYWHQQVQRKRTFVNDEGDPIPFTTDNQDIGHWEITWDDLGWEPTSPLPANNASALAHYLNKGFRLRPPLDGVEAEKQGVEPADLPESFEQPDERPIYRCKRHPKGIVEFRSWDGYLKHCVHFKEPPTEKPPQDVLDLMAQWKYFCVLHNVGFNSPAHATRHYKAEMRKGGRAAHPTPDDMLVEKGDGS